MTKNHEIPWSESELSDEEHLTLWVAATRYYLARSSRRVSDFCTLLIRVWPHLPERTRAMIQRDVEEAFAQLARHQAGELPRNPLGMACDVRAWSRVRRLWGQET